MCWASDTIRHFVGIYPYVPGDHPHARVRKPTRYGTRGNGHAPSGPPVPTHPAIEDLAREHRIIRQIIDDAARRRSWGQG